MGNAVSQYSLVRFAQATQMPFLVVFEDDAVPCDNAAEAIVKAFETKPEDCLCLSLGWTYSDPPQKEEIAKRGDCTICYGSHAYVLFGEKAYEAFQEQWAKNGRADVCISKMEGSYKGKEPIFGQSTLDTSIHLPNGWLADATEEQAIDGNQARRFARAYQASKKIKDDVAIHVAYTIDVKGAGAEQFCNQLFVSVYSLLTTKGKNDDIRIHILYSELSADCIVKLMKFNRDDFKIDFIKIPNAVMGELEKCARRDPRQNIRVFSGITFARYCLPAFLPNVKKVVYLDADTMAIAPIRELWETTFGERDLIAAPYGIVPEYGFYSGTIVINCEGFRKQRELIDQFLAYAQQDAWRFYLPDQTAMNRFFAGRIKRIDSAWIFPPTPLEHKP